MNYAKAVLLAVLQVVSCPLFSEEQKPTSIYNNAKLIFHAIGSKFPSPQLEGFDPGQSIEVMETTLVQFIEQNPELSQEMRDRISKMRIIGSA
jgi:hypothetical protein